MSQSIDGKTYETTDGEQKENSKTKIDKKDLRLPPIARP
jgi:hypothetical protein